VLVGLPETARRSYHFSFQVASSLDPHNFDAGCLVLVEMMGRRREERIKSFQK
jgi:hypothetical protein